MCSKSCLLVVQVETTRNFSLQHALAEYIDVISQVNVQVEASYILIPETGTYRPGESTLIVIDLGQLAVNSEKDSQAPKKYRAKAAMEKARREQQTLDNQVQHYMQLSSHTPNAYTLYTESIHRRNARISSCFLFYIIINKQLSEPVIKEPVLLLGKMYVCMVTEQTKVGIRVHYSEDVHVCSSYRTMN